MKFKLLILSILLSSFFACKQKTTITDNADECPQGAPSAIFSDTMETVASQTFEVENLRSTEYIVFKNRLKLELIQSGCEDLVQDFRFELPGDYSKETETMFWLNEATFCFRYLAECSTKPGMLSFHNYGRMIAESAYDGMELGTAKAVGDGQYLKVEKLVTSTHSILMINLSIGEQ